ncbi:SDR family oxidoreductase [Candidatus Pelagibacter sp.]|nr:SDR family oxidoreductase [Candidatus Pelagibacter sp.]
MKNLNKNILITGSEGQIGKNLTTLLTKNNYNLILLDKFKKNENHYYSVDFNNNRKLKIVTNKLIKKYNNIYGLINLAAYQVFSDFEYRTFDEIEKSLNVNLKANIFLSQFIFKNFFKKQKYGKIINISSIFGMYSPDFKNYKKGDRKSSEIYSATKAGIIQLTKYFSNYMSNSNINVNCISPGGVENKNKQTKNFIRRYSQKNPSKRMAKVEEISSLILFLLSEKSDYINGENIVIDGGYSSKL